MKAFEEFSLKYCLGGLFCVITMEARSAVAGPELFKRLSDTAPEYHSLNYVKHNIL